MAGPQVDLVIAFRPKTHTLSKEEAQTEAKAAEEQYAALIRTLTDAGLKAAGRLGDGSDLLVLVWAPWAKVVQLMQRDKHVDFLHGLPSSSLPVLADDLQPSKLSAANRLRLVYGYVTTSQLEGGLGIIPRSQQWRRVESVLTLHDEHFNEHWVHSWTTQQLGFGLKFQALDKIKQQFGEEVALYFFFLSFYARSLLFPAALGIAFFILGQPYHPLYSIVLMAWSVTFVEWWSIRERILSIRWGTKGSANVERRRPEYVARVRKGDSDDEDDFPWWIREFRVIASIPVILVFAAIMAALLFGVFILEAFVAQMYTGPGKEYITLAPTILLVALVPQLLALHQRVAEKLTQWENHMHRSSHEASLTIKVFALSGVVAYLGLGLSAFVYVPFGENMMTFFHSYIAAPNATIPAEHPKITAFRQEQFQINLTDARKKLDRSRLQKQMFAYMVTNQIVGAFLEIVLPFIMRGATAVQKQGFKGLDGKKQHVQSTDHPEEAQFLQNVRAQVALPDYTVFADYAEMVTQFGYVTLWSTMWPLAPLMALLNNWLELRGDAFKIAKNFRRPVPTRIDTVGPWLESLSFISWLGALTNSALVYMFRPINPTPAVKFGTGMDAAHVPVTGAPQLSTFLVTALLIALASSHGYFLARWLVRHLLERVFWMGTAERRLAERFNREVKVRYLQEIEGREEGLAASQYAEDDTQMKDPFWGRDDAVGELERRLKQA